MEVSLNLVRSNEIRLLRFFSVRLDWFRLGLVWMGSVKLNEIIVYIHSDRRTFFLNIFTIVLTTKIVQFNVTDQKTFPNLNTN